jgi:hypothetical protein
VGGWVSERERAETAELVTIRSAADGLKTAHAATNRSERHRHV